MPKRRPTSRSRRKNNFSALTVCILVLIAAVYVVFSEKTDFTPDAPHVEGNSYVHYIDVGQGDCELIVASDGTTMLIDSGEKEYGAVVLGYLEDLGITRLDYVVATHPHSDHMGGLATVISSELEIGKIYMPKVADDYVPTTKTYENFLQAVANKNMRISKAENTSFDFGDGKIYMYVADYDGNNLNNYSIVIKYVYGETSFLFTGDIEAEIEKYYVSLGTDLDSDVLKVCHHGSSTSSTVAFLDAVSPDYCVIECGDNSYNHPNSDIVKRLLGYTEEIYRTDVQGTVIFTTDGANLTYDFTNN